MAQMRELDLSTNASFQTSDHEITSIMVTFESVTGTWGVTLSVVDTDANKCTAQVTMGAADVETDARTLQATMADALRAHGHAEIEI